MNKQLLKIVKRNFSISVIVGLFGGFAIYLCNQNIVMSFAVFLIGLFVYGIVDSVRDYWELKQNMKSSIIQQQTEKGNPQ